MGSLRRWLTLIGYGCMTLILLFGVTACDDGDDGAPGADGSPIQTQSMDPPSGPAGQFTINTMGGTGTAGSGGGGGDLDLEISDGSLGGNILIFNTGAADASFDFPAVTTYLGDVPLMIDADTTISVVSAEPDSGTAYMVEFDSSVYISDGDGELQDEDPVTGISVAADTVLTFGLNYTGEARVDLENDFHNAGTVTVDNSAVITPTATGLISGDFDLEASVYYGEATSSIDVAGGVSPTDGSAVVGPGGDGGDIDFDVAAFYNMGTFNSSGGDGETVGGDAGSIYIYADLRSINTGDMMAMGGNASAGDGGDGDYIEIDTDYGNNFNSGNFDASGGDGSAFGGDAGYLYLYIGYPGDILNSGNLTANGGNGPDGGGSADYIYFYVYGGDIVSSGDLAATGGDAVDGEGVVGDGSGGSGGDLDVGSSYDNGWEGDYQPVGDMLFSGNIDLSGGIGASGGTGGDVDFSLDAEYVSWGQQIVLYGYTGIATAGGDGSDSGGSAGDIYIYNDYADNDGYPSDYGPSGGNANYANVDASGGNVTGTESGDGGAGGDFEMYTEYYYGFGTDSEITMNMGDLNLAGGNGVDSAGDGGEVYLWGYNHAENQGNIMARGGDASGATGEAGGGADAPSFIDFAVEGGELDGDAYFGVYILSDLGPAMNSGDIDASGGDATGTGANFGGNGGGVQIVGYSADNSGALSVAGGDADLTDGTGGYAEHVFIYGIFDGATNSATEIDVSGGAGGTEGDSGSIYIDAMDMTGSF